MLLKRKGPYKLEVSPYASQYHAYVFRARHLEPLFLVSGIDLGREIVGPIDARGLCVAVVEDVVDMAWIKASEKASGIQIIDIVYPSKSLSIRITGSLDMVLPCCPTPEAPNPRIS